MHVSFGSFAAGIVTMPKKSLCAPTVSALMAGV